MKNTEIGETPKTAGATTLNQADRTSRVLLSRLRKIRRDLYKQQLELEKFGEQVAALLKDENE